jgi:hypothetical protein
MPSLRAGRIIGLSIVATLGILASNASFAVAAPSAPAWAITAPSQPTSFMPKTTTSAAGAGPHYYIVATNSGSADITEPFTVTDELPPGLVPAPARAPSGDYGKEGSGQATPMTCSTVATTITCTSTPGVLHPGELVRIIVPVKVNASAGEEVNNVATISGGGASSPATVITGTQISNELPPFSLMSGSNAPFAKASNGDGSATVQAGSHPYRLTIQLAFPGYQVVANEADNYGVGGGVRDIAVTLPPGVVVDPGAVQKCKETELTSERGCPLASQVGTIQVMVNLGGVAPGSRPLYDMVAPGGSPGVFAVEVVKGIYVHLVGRLNSEGRYELAAEANDILAKSAVLGATTTLWGNPTDPSHDNQRGGECIVIVFPSCSTPPKNVAFVTMPSSCSSSLEFSAEADSWEAPDVIDRRTFVLAGLEGNPTSITGCTGLPFNPTIGIRPDEPRADSPSGLSVALHIPQNEEYENQAGEVSTATSTLRDAKVTLPAGVSVNPAAANGRTACTPAQVGLKTPVGQLETHFTDAAVTCPDASKIGAVEIETPLLKDEPSPGVQVPHVLPGSIYLAQPFENPFNSLLGIYVAVDDPQTGVSIKLAGEVRADPVTGQLTATFRENPQVPFEDFRLNFFGGPRATLRMPSTCGPRSSQSELAPWSGGASVSGTDQFPITEGAGGGSCPTTPQQQPNSPTFEAGTASPAAGGYSPFVLHLNRADGSQEFSALNVTLPPGLTGKLAGTPYCSDAALAAAATKSGRQEQAQPSCPAASEVGSVTVGAGAGSLPLYVQGKAYLAGPYKGDPLSLAIVTPAVAGPYDLGTVVVRSALHVDPFTAQISVHSDPLPTILQGIPLDIRSVTVSISKPGFTLNPTSCEPASVTGEVVSTIGQSAALGNRFQAAGCGSLKFNPSLSLSLKGPTQRTGHPALKAVVKFPQKGASANIARAQVALPHSEFFDQGNIAQACTKPVLLANACPKSSIYGKAKAWTPLLEKPLEGPVYLVGGFGFKLPALVAELDGQIKVLLVGKVDTGKSGGIRNTFEAVPDAPVEKFVLEMKGGNKYGLLENSENLCRNPQKAGVAFKAQSGRLQSVSVKIANSCKGGKGKKKTKKK